MCNAEVKNVSDRAVRAVTFGVLLHGSAPNHSEPILASSREMQTDIKPGGVRTLDVLDLTVKEVQVTATQLKSDRVIAEFGILGVQFNDGGSWIFDLQKNGGFSTSAVSASADPAATMRCKPTISSGLVALLDKVLPPLAVVLAQGYTCAISPNTEVGTNNVSSCKKEGLHPRRGKDAYLSLSALSTAIAAAIKETKPNLCLLGGKKAFARL